MAIPQAFRSAREAVWVGRAGSLGRERNRAKLSHNSFINAATHQATRQWSGSRLPCQSYLLAQKSRLGRNVSSDKACSCLRSYALG